MEAGGTCTEVGPFFPPTPRYMVQSGFTLRSDILLEPDWLLIGLLIAAALVVVIVLIVALMLFKKYGWSKVMYLVPYYRALTKKFSFDDYSSKVSLSVVSYVFIQSFLPFHLVLVHLLVQNHRYLLTTCSLFAWLLV